MTKTPITCLCLVASGLLAALPSPSDAASASAGRSKDILGWVEWVEVGQAPLQLKAKLDTGATTSSLTADEVEVFERDGKRHVRFVVRDPARDVDQTLEATLVRHVRIRRHGGEVQRRPVVSLEMCLGTVRRKEEFTLIDRSSFVYPVLVGRNFMKDHVIVDSGATFIQRPACESDKAEIADAGMRPA